MSMKMMSSCCMLSLLALGRANFLAPTAKAVAAKADAFPTPFIAAWDPALQQAKAAEEWMQLQSDWQRKNALSGRVQNAAWNSNVRRMKRMTAPARRMAAVAMKESGQSTREFQKQQRKLQELGHTHQRRVGKVMRKNQEVAAQSAQQVRHTATSESIKQTNTGFHNAIQHNHAQQKLMKQASMETKKNTLHALHHKNDVLNKADRVARVEIQEGRRNAKEGLRNLQSVRAAAERQTVKNVVQTAKTQAEVAKVAQRELHKTAVKDAQRTKKTLKSVHQAEVAVSKSAGKASKAKLDQAKDQSDAIIKQVKKEAGREIRAEKQVWKEAKKFNAEANKAMVERQVRAATDTYENTEAVSKQAQLDDAWRKTLEAKDTQEMMDKAAQSPYAKQAAQVVAEAYGKQLAEAPVKQQLMEHAAENAAAKLTMQKVRAAQAADARKTAQIMQEVRKASGDLD